MTDLPKQKKHPTSDLNEIHQDSLFLKLPKDTLTVIFGFLDFQSLLIIPRLCKVLKEIDLNQVETPVSHNLIVILVLEISCPI
jgi:hypothetical protein